MSTNPITPNAQLGISESTIYILFAGLRQGEILLNRGKEPDAAFVQLTEEEVRKQELLREVKTSELVTFSMKLLRQLRWCRVGAVYRVEKTETGISYKPKTAPAFVIRGDNPQVVQWHAQHRAVERDYEAAKRLQKEARTRPDVEHLEPFRKAYARLNGPQQAQLIADVVVYITRGRSKEKKP